jgi:hypothetical protein
MQPVTAIWEGISTVYVILISSPAQAADFKSIKILYVGVSPHNLDRQNLHLDVP